MRNRKRNIALFLWAGLSIAGGAARMSFHQPFREANPLALMRLAGESHTGWRMVHVLSGSYSCSQRVMRDILTRQDRYPAQDVVLVVDDGITYLRGSEGLPAQRYSPMYFRPLRLWGRGFLFKKCFKNELSPGKVASLGWLYLEICN